MWRDAAMVIDRGHCPRVLPIGGGAAMLIYRGYRLSGHSNRGHPV